MDSSGMSMSEEQYRQLLEVVDEGILIIDPDNRLLVANPMGLRLLGIEQVPGSTPRQVDWQLLDNANEPIAPPRYPFAECRRTQQAVHTPRLGVRRPDGTLVWLLARCVPDAADPANVLMALSESADARVVGPILHNLRGAIECLQEPLIVADADGCITYVNPAFTQVSGYTAEEVVGQKSFELICSEQDQHFCSHLLETIRQGRPWKGSMVTRWKGGAPCELEVCISPLPGLEVPAPFVTIMRNRTELERQLAHSQRLETVGILAGNIAHDFNNLLYIICGNIENILEAIPKTDPIRRHLLVVQTASGQAAELTRDLLNFSRKSTPRSITCDLNKAAAEAFRLMRHTRPPNVELRTEFFCEPLLMRGDPTQLHQVIVNLCMNARDAMPQGGVMTLRTSDHIIDDARDLTSADARVGEFVALGVEDTGHGISPEVLARVFEPFFTTKDSGRGTGLGLTIVRNIVDMHHGWVEIKSTPGKGTRVNVYFPSRTTLVDEPRRVIDPSSLHGAGTVLVVDDESMIVALLRTALEMRGYTTLVATTSKEAVTVFEQHHQSIRAVVLDRNLPSVDGLPLYKRLRQVVANLPVVLISGSVPVNEEEPIPTDKNARFVAKPFTSVEVLEALKLVLSNARI